MKGKEEINALNRRNRQLAELNVALVSENKELKLRNQHLEKVVTSHQRDEIALEQTKNLVQKLEEQRKVNNKIEADLILATSRVEELSNTVQRLANENEEGTRLSLECMAILADLGKTPNLLASSRAGKRNTRSGKVIKRHFKLVETAIDVQKSLGKTFIPGKTATHND